MIYALAVASALVTSYMPTAPAGQVATPRMTSVVMSEPMMARRAVVGTFAAAAAAAPLAAFADVRPLSSHTG